MGLQKPAGFWSAKTARFMKSLNNSEVATGVRRGSEYLNAHQPEEKLDPKLTFEELVRSLRRGKAQTSGDYGDTQRQCSSEWMQTE
jgi:hypothetical protein